MFREFAVLRNRTGLVMDPNMPAIGGETFYLLGKHNVLPANREITYEPVQSQTTVYIAPSATIDVWNSYFESVAGLSPPTQSAAGETSDTKSSKYLAKFGRCTIPWVLIAVGLAL
jgi:hypothetical protein